MSLKIDKKYIIFLTVFTFILSISSMYANSEWESISNLLAEDTFTISNNGWNSFYLDKATGLLYATGSNYYGQTGTGDTISPNTHIPSPKKVLTPTNQKVKDFAIGKYSEYALLDSGQVYAWGDNTLGELGDGTTITKNSPVKVLLPDNLKATQLVIDAEDTYTLAYGYALMEDGSIYSWGSNYYGELGNGSSTGSSIPTKVQLPTNLKAIQVTKGHGTGYALMEDGSIYSWGHNNFGQLGNGLMRDSKVPVKVRLSSSIAVKFIFAENGLAYAITNSSGVYGWGYNQYGGLGVGSTGNKRLPTKLLFDSENVDIIQMVDSGTTTFALSSIGVVYSWGLNKDGSAYASGNGTTMGSTAPVSILVPSGTIISAISAISNAGFALTNDGNVYSWGENYNGQLGIGNNTNNLTPSLVKFNSGTIVSKLMDPYNFGGDTFIIITSTNQILGWGANFEGDLGNGVDGNTYNLPTSAMIFQ